MGNTVTSVDVINPRGERSAIHPNFHGPVAQEFKNIQQKPKWLEKVNTVFKNLDELPLMVVYQPIDKDKLRIIVILRHTSGPNEGKSEIILATTPDGKINPEMADIADSLYNIFQIANGQVKTPVTPDDRQQHPQIPPQEIARIKQDVHQAVQAQAASRGQLKPRFELVPAAPGATQPGTSASLPPQAGQPALRGQQPTILPAAPGLRPRYNLVQAGMPAVPPPGGQLAAQPAVQQQVQPPPVVPHGVAPVALPPGGQPAVQQQVQPPPVVPPPAAQQAPAERSFWNWLRRRPAHEEIPLAAEEEVDDQLDRARPHPIEERLQPRYQLVMPPAHRQAGAVSDGESEDSLEEAEPAREMDPHDEGRLPPRDQGDALSEVSDDEFFDAPQQPEPAARRPEPHRREEEVEDRGLQERRLAREAQAEAENREFRQAQARARARHEQIEQLLTQARIQELRRGADRLEAERGSIREEIDVRTGRLERIAHQLRDGDE